MTQRESDFLFKLTEAFLPFFIAVYSVITSNYTLAVLMLVDTVIIIIAAILGLKKTIVVKSIVDLEKDSDIKNQINQTVEGKFIDDICEYALSKGLNPGIDFAPTGPVLNTFVENKCLGICELTMPDPNTKYLSDNYKSSVEEAKENIDKFVKNNPYILNNQLEENVND